MAEMDVKTRREKSKSKNHHQFVAISVSNATTCDVCQKSMVNKAALRCENCLLTVHEHNCQDQIVGCDKSRRKALHRDGSSHGAQGPTQTAQSVTMEQRPPLAGTSLRHTQSMVHRRPMSINIQRHLPGQRFGKSLSMTGRTTSEESDTSPVTMAESRKGSMDDSIYESLESPDGMIPPEILLNDEPDLQLLVYEPETWISTVPEEVQNKLNKRDIERQHNIWELIGTEKQYVKRLKIMQKIFAKPLLHEMNYPENLVNQLFPQLDELVELHTKFLRQLLNRQARNENRFVNEIGDILVAQFQGSTADKMKSIYGVFCSRQAETVQLYKELMKTDKKFMSFIKKCSKLPVCEKREISEFILVVTHRLTKYGILMEQILKNTTDEKDWENLDQALLSCKNVVQQIDDKVAAYIKLKDIQNKMDPRTVKFKGKKFTRMDLTADKRELLHVGLIGWKNSKDQVIETLALVLTDLLVFLQKNEQKLTFLMQDNKQPVISLHNLMVKQKQDLQDNLGIFIINPDHKNPEMYELVCKSKKFREDWIMILQDAIRACPPDKEPVLWPGRNSPGPVLSNMLEKHRRSEYTSQVKNIIEKLHQKDEIIKECCDAKNKLMLELLELSTPCSEPGSRTNSQEIDSLSESMEIVHAAMQEASRLTNILQSSSTILNRSISNTFEYHSNTLAPSPVPKRGETFSNSESFHVSKRRGSNNIFGSIEQEEIEEQLLSMQYQDQPKAKRNSLDIQETSLEFKCGDDGNARKESMSSDQSSDQDSFGELSASVTSLVPSLSSQEQMTSVFHLVQYLNALMNLTSKQCTKVEILRSELAEAKEEISKLSADMHNRRLCSVGQLEELRNLQEVINQEKQEWERKKLEDFSRLETERKKLEDELLKIRVEKMDLDVHKEDLKKEQKVLQSQIEMLNDLRQGLQVCSTPDNILKGAHLENVSKNSTTQQGPINHERSESADLYDTVYTTDFENIQSCPQYAWKSNVGDSHLTNLTDSLQDQNPATAAASNNHNTFPQHLTYSHNNNNNVNVEDSPEKECWI